MPLKQETSIEDYVAGLIARGAMPGISILVARRDRLVFEACYGNKALQPRPEILQPGTIYDLASLTKPLITGFLAVYLLSRAEIRLEDEVRRYAPHIGISCTLAQLLTHTSGLPDWHPFYLYHPVGRIGLEAYAQLAPAYRPGKKVLYSCVGYMLLCRVLEQAAGVPLTRLADDVLLSPLRLTRSSLALPEARRSEAAPTEKGNVHERGMGLRHDRRAAGRYPWRRAMIQGQTHDVNSFHQGGFAGNAGLFADVRDVWRLALEFFPETATILDPSFINLFWTNFTPRFRTHRSIGFKLNSSFVTSGGRALEPDAIGHNGFTGTSIWLEKMSGRVWILLANRIHPRVPAAAFDPQRRRLHRLLRRELDLP